jgi:hypothetical protein
VTPGDQVIDYDILGIPLSSTANLTSLLPIQLLGESMAVTLKDLSRIKHLTRFGHSNWMQRSENSVIQGCLYLIWAHECQGHVSVSELRKRYAATASKKVDDDQSRDLNHLSHDHGHHAMTSFVILLVASQ